MSRRLVLSVALLAAACGSPTNDDLGHDQVIREELASADSSCRTAAPSGGFVNQGFEPQSIAFTASYEAVPTAANVDAVVGFSAGLAGSAA